MAVEYGYDPDRLFLNDIAHHKRESSHQGLPHISIGFRERAA